MKRTTTVLSVSALAAAALSIPLASVGANATSAPRVVSADQAPGLAADEQATVSDTRTTPDGTTITRYERTYKGLPVNGGRYAVVQTPGESLADGEVLAKTDVAVDDTTPALTADQAAAKVDTADLLDGARLTRSTAALIIYVDAQQQPHLAYDVYVEGSGENVLDVKKHAFIDATTGALLDVDSDVKSGRGDGIYDKNVTFGTKQTSRGYTFGDSHGNTTNDLAGGQSGPGNPMFDNDDVWGGTNRVQAQGVDAQKGVELTYDFYNSTYGRRGIWDNGRGAVARVRWKNCFPNAQWDGQYISLGEGRGCANPLTQLDIMAHEMTHGVTGATANFRYSRESGGLNEAMSDIFGTLTEWYADMQGDTPDYLLGELVNFNGDHKPLRYMDQPSKDGRSLDCWSPSIATGSVDVHFSSGPMNHAFYLMAEGSGAKTVRGVSYYSPTCNGGTVSGIGHEKAGKIVYTALTSPSVSEYSTYKQWRDELIKAAKSLYGASSAECHATEDAMAGIAAPAGSQACTGGPTTTSSSSTGQGGVTALSNGVGVPASGDRGSEQVYSITVPAGATNLVMSTSGGTGDVDLYTRFGSKPTDTAYDCRPYQNGNNETCTVAVPQAGTYYLRLRGYSTYSGVTVKASYSNGGPGTTTSTTSSTTVTSTGGALQNGVPVTVSGGAGSDQYYTFSLPLTATNLKVTTSGGTGDVDMSLRWYMKPTDTSYDCRPFQTGNDESCTVQYPYSGTYYVRLNGKQDFAGVTLTASWN